MEIWVIFLTKNIHYIHIYRENKEDYQMAEKVI